MKRAQLQGAPLSIHMKQMTEYILEQIQLILLRNLSGS